MDFFVSLSDRTKSIIGLVALASIIMIIAILVVYFTAAKESNKVCNRSFKSITGHSNAHNSRPRFVTNADMNNDTHLDIIVANSGTDAIGIFYGYGNGSFASQTLYLTGVGSEPYSATIADFNRDSLLDIVVANHGTNSIGILLSLGGGNFTKSKTFSLGSSRPVSIISADFNNDNLLDIATANYDTRNVGVILGYGNGSFGIHTTYSTGFDSSPYFVTVADFNGDNRLDIAVANSGTSNVGIFLGRGNGSFEIQMIFSTGYNSIPYSIAIIDIDNDKKLDIVVANYGSSSIGILLGYGNGSFGIVDNYFLDTKFHPNSIIVHDFNQDKQTDIAILDSNYVIVFILHGPNISNFSSQEIYSTGFSSLSLSMTTGDFNGDNILDFVVANSGSNDINLLLRYIFKPFSNHILYSTTDNSAPVEVVLGDFNNDGHVDLAVLNQDTANVAIFVSYGNGTLTSVITYSVGSGSAPKTMATADFNNDHILDIVTANTQTSSVSLLFGNGDGSFGNLSSYSTGNSSYPTGVDVADFNDDNHIDITVANYDSDEIVVFLGYGNGSFRQPLKYAFEDGSNPESIAVSDFNYDNQVDIVVTTFGAYKLVILLGYGNGTFRKVAEYFMEENVSPIWVVVADINNDKRIDIAAVNYPSGDAAILLGNGDGTFANPVLYPTGKGTFARKISLCDLNNDNNLDIVSANYGTNSMGVFFGYGNGTFAEVITYFIGDGFQSMAVVCANLNNDKWLDLIAAYVETNSIGVFLGLDYTYATSKIVYTTGSGSHPNSVAVNDFNNDGKLDMAIVNAGNENIGIRLGFGNGYFDNETTYFLGSGFYPQFVTLADINVDHKIDIIAISPVNDTLIILYGYGDGTFRRQEIYSTGDRSQPSAIAFADFNNDKKPDVVVANQGTDSVGVFLSFNYTTFGHQKIYQTGLNAGPYVIAVGDLNHDNQSDIVITNSGRDNIGIFFGHGNGSFSSQITYSTGRKSDPRFVAFGDINNDNQLDIVLANHGSANIGILVGYGNGTFTSQTTYQLEPNSKPTCVVVYDLNHDENLDIIVTDTGTNQVWILLGYGNESFSRPMNYSTGIGSHPLCVAIGDLNNDNQSDIVVTNYHNDNIKLFFGYGNGSFSTPITLLTDVDSNPTSATITDVNHDGHMDLVVTEEATGAIVIFLGYSNGSFAAQRTYSTGNGSLPYFVLFTDLNKDNCLDMISVDFGSNSIGIFFGYGDGTFTDQLEFSTGDGSGPNWVAVADFNNDNKLDLAVANWGSDTMCILLQDGYQPFLKPVVYSTGNSSQPRSIAISDFNNDHQMDIAVVNYGNNNVGILFGHGNGTFQNQNIYAAGLGSGLCSIAVGDMNNDNQSDIVIANSLTNSISILLGYGNGTFLVKSSCSTGDDSHPIMVSIADINKDSILDIIVVNQMDNNVLVLFGYGNGSFSEKQSYLMGYQSNPSSVALGDFNNDSWIDMAITNYGTDDVQILLQTC